MVPKLCMVLADSLLLFSLHNSCTMLKTALVNARAPRKDNFPIMKLKRFIATAAATAIATTAIVAPASAQDSSNDLSSTFGNSSNAGNVESPDFETNPDFEPGEEGSSPTGSSAGDLTLIFGGTAILAKLITDNVPVLRQAVNDIAASINMQTSSGSSEDNRLNQGGLDFDLERLARTNGLTEIADQLSAMKATSS